MSHHYRPEPGSLARQLAEPHCPCGAVRGRGRIICIACQRAATAAGLEMPIVPLRQPTLTKQLLTFAHMRRNS